MSLPLPASCVAVNVELRDGDVVLVSWIDALLGDLVEVDATLSEIAAWEKAGEVPDDLAQRETRWNATDLDRALRDLHGRQGEIEARLDRFRR